MSSMIQIRNVPDDVHRQLKARAALAGTSMSEWVLQRLVAALERPTRAELLERVRGRARVELPIDAASLLREEREGR